MKLHVTNLEKRFGDKQVLGGATHIFEQGKIYGLLGRNGAGKTTLFNCLSSGLKPDGGETTLEGDDGHVRPVTFDDVGLVFTQPHLPEFMTGYEFIQYFVRINKDKIKQDVNLDEAFASIDFDEEDRHKLIKDCSHGMQNKLQLLAFLVLRPPVILLDEPLTSFDVIVALQIKNLIKSIKQDHVILFSTHILQLAQDLCDEVVILHNGKLSPVDATRLHEKDFEEQVIEMLRDEEGGNV